MNFKKLTEPTNDEEAKALEEYAQSAFLLLGNYYEKKEILFRETVIDMPTLGERLRALREHNHLTRADVNKRCGVSIDSIADYERGKTLPRVKVLIAFACCFNVTVDLLLGNRRKERKDNE